MMNGHDGSNVVDIQGEITTTWRTFLRALFSRFRNTRCTPLRITAAETERHNDTLTSRNVMVKSSLIYSHLSYSATSSYCEAYAAAAFGARSFQNILNSGYFKQLLARRI
jgi:hypothetical protein